MNKAITDGIVFQPLPFAAGLSVWSSGDGTPGSDTYATSGTGVFVPSDQDFGGALEVQKTETVQRLRYMAETPLLPGTYLRITARVKAIAGPLPAVRIAGFAGRAGGGAASVPTTTGPQVQLTSYGTVVEVAAIVGTGDRTGVDLVWQDAIYGHFGLDLVGESGGLVRIDDIEIEDYTVAFLRDLISMVDVRDYGAMGDGVTDDSVAFEAADTAARGREILVPRGVYHLADDVSIQSKIRFEGTVTQPAQKRLILQNGYNLRKYVEAFGDEELAFKKAYQALLNFSDHESLDMGGIRVTLTEPLDMQACDPTRTVYATRRVVRNGQFQPANTTAWDTHVVTSPASYALSSEKRLSNVTNIANIPVGSLVTGSGVGREVYVTSVNVGARTLELSQPLYDAVGTQTFTFRRFKYLVDFSGYDDLAQFVLDDIEFQCAGLASGDAAQGSRHYIARARLSGHDD
ncbi:glycosyl hydrolase family 28-related protein [Loktanella sp. SALINAS62]|uniref:glycosyl hydrolase family 28-related protein n=1 Tax=Loktanella sp. SALINAS62 TaxID=2706124 RepID=UPI0032C4627B